MKILLIAGHGANDPGACSSYGIERDEARKIVNEMVTQFKNYNNATIDVYPQNRNCYSDICNGVVQKNFGSYDYVFEVHFNSASASAKGTEIWVTPQEKSVVVEQGIVNKLASCGFSNRGVKRDSFAVINHAKNKGVSGALVEVCFISNVNDMVTYKAKFKQVCEAMVKGIAEGFGLSKKSTTTTTPAPAPTTTTKEKYRVRKSWADASSQIGAYSIKENAIKACPSGYKVFDSKGNQVYPATTTTQTNGEVCRIIVNGTNKVALTGLEKCKEYVKANYPKEKVEIQRVSDGKILWTQAKYVAPKPQPTPSSTTYKEIGVFTFNTAVQIRTQPANGYETGVCYYAGESVTYDTVILNKNGFNWIVYTRSNGQRGYLKIRDLATGERYGTAK